MTTLAFSADDRSHAVRPSYIVLPVKRLPSKPWSGCPTVFGISAAVIPIRTTLCAEAAEAATASTPASTNVRPLSGCLIVLASGTPLGTRSIGVVTPRRSKNVPVESGIIGHQNSRPRTERPSAVQAMHIAWAKSKRVSRRRSTSTLKARSAKKFRNKFWTTARHSRRPSTSSAEASRVQLRTRRRRRHRRSQALEIAWKNAAAKSAMPAQPSTMQSAPSSANARSISAPMRFFRRSGICLKRENRHFRCPHARAALSEPVPRQIVLYDRDGARERRYNGKAHPDHAGRVIGGLADTDDRRTRPRCARRRARYRRSRR